MMNIFHYKDGPEQVNALLENWSELKASRDAGSHISALLLEDLEYLIESRLTSEQADILKLYYYFGYSQYEIGLKLGKTQSGVRWILTQSTMIIKNRG